ncbi:MAG TPA: hypothetical protein VNP73_00115 [Actinomycetota bacterium]|nr:hypothetical protein [Actinomycetota bacterium]
MHISVAVDLLRALGLAMDAYDQERAGQPSNRETRMRARGVAEREAIRRLMGTQSFLASLRVGAQTYVRERSYFRPLTFERAQEDSGEERAVLDLTVEEQAWN